jgi:hypothetical protein
LELHKIDLSLLVILICIISASMPVCAAEKGRGERCEWELLSASDGFRPLGTGEARRESVRSIKPVKDVLTSFAQESFPDFTGRVVELGPRRVLAKVVSQRGSVATLLVVHKSGDADTIAETGFLRRVNVNLASLGSRISESSEGERFDRVFRIAEILQSRPEIREGKSGLFFPPVTIPMDIGKLQISPEIREALIHGIYGLKPHLRVLIDKIDLERLKIRFTYSRSGTFDQSDHKVEFGLTEEFLMESSFEPNEVARFILEGSTVWQGHEDFRARFALGRLQPGDYIVSPKSDFVDVFKVTGVSGYEISVVAPGGAKILFKSPEDLAPLFLPYATEVKTVAQLFQNRAAQADSASAGVRLKQQLSGLGLTWKDVEGSVAAGRIPPKFLGNRRLTIVLNRIAQASDLENLADHDRRVVLDFVKLFNQANSDARKLTRNRHWVD